MKFDRNYYFIKKQQILAKECINLLNKNNCEAVLAGGAPRDWYVLGEPAKDLDIFYEIPKGEVTPESIGQQFLSGLFGFVENATLSQEVRDKYASLDPSIFSVHNWKFDDVEVQFIGCTTSVQDRHETFSLNISQIKWSPLYGYSTTEEFLQCHFGHKEIRQMNTGFNLFDNYVSRMNLKFMHKGYKPLIISDELQIVGG